MKIAIFSRTFDGVVGGVEKMVITLASELVKSGHSVVVISLDSSNAQAFYPWPEGVAWEKIDLGNPDIKAKLLTRLQRMLKMRKILRAYCVEAAAGFQIGCFSLLRLSGAGLGIHMVAAERNAPTLFNFIQNGRKLRLASNLLLYFSDTISVQMESYRSLYPKWLRHKIFVNPNPIFSVQKNRLRAIHSLGPIKLLYIGRVTFQKNLQVLVRALAKSGINAELSIVGNGTDLAETRSLAASLGITLHHFNPTVDLSSHYLNADVFCITSRWEGFPNVVGESLAHGLPVVAFDGCAGMPELVVSGVNGILALGNDNVDSYAEALTLASRTEWDPNVIVASCKAYSLDNFVDKWVLALTPKELRN